MSDYGDDYSDYGEDWLYIEEEYIVADDLAEHAVPSPPPTVYDDDMLLDWDRFNYFNDLEYASDGYDNASFETNNSASAAKIGQKRKRGATATRGRKKQRLTNPRALGRGDSTMLCNSPIVWRSQTNRAPKLRMLAENAESYALMKNWREKVADTPEWVRRSSYAASSGRSSSKAGKAHASSVSELVSPAPEADVGEEEEDAGIDPAALMAALQERLAAAGGPLNGMDPQQLLEFAMRMATDNDAGDDIAGEMADEMLGQGDEDEEDEEAEEKLLAWVAQQQNASKQPLPNRNSLAVASTPKSPVASRNGKRPPTPPSSEANRSVCVADEVMGNVAPSTENTTAFTKNHTLEAEQVSRKRKATDATNAENSTTTAKRRATRSYEAPTTSSQARTTASRTTKSRRVKR